MVWQEMWAHYVPSILNQGRLTHQEVAAEEGEDEVEPEELQKREVAKDPWEPLLKPITQDNNVRGGNPAWVIRSFNVRDTYLNSKTQKPTENYGVVVVKSQWWPGAFSFYNNRRVLQIYVGNG